MAKTRCRKKESFRRGWEAFFVVSRPLVGAKAETECGYWIQTKSPDLRATRPALRESNLLLALLRGLLRRRLLGRRLCFLLSSHGAWYLLSVAKCKAGKFF